MESYTKGPTVALLDQTIYQAFEETARKFPGRDAVVALHQNVRLSYAVLDEEVNRTARGLAGLGLRTQDRIGIWATNCVEWILLQLASARAGIVLVNVNPAYRSHELAYVLRKSGMKAIFLRESDSRADYREILEAARRNQDNLPLQHDIYIGHESWERMLAGGVDLPGEEASPHDTTNIQYTSGTTGSPKGVLLTHHNLVNNAYLLALGMRITERDRICAPVPMYHCFGCVMSAILCYVTGAALIMPACTFDALATLEAIHAERATALYGVPTMFIAELEHPEFPRFDMTSLRTGIMAGAPCPVEVMKQVVDRMHLPEMTIVYGQTECSPVITGSAVDDSLELRVSTVGSAFPCTEVKIVSPAGKIVPAGEQGELCARGYLVMKGYDGEPEATTRVLDADGWLRTGDLATMRPDGYFKITGRSKDMVIRGGENIYPREIEEFLYTHPKIADVQVIGVPDLKLGETIGAWIRLKAGESATEDEIRDYCRGRIAHFKIPQYVRFVDAFPMTVTGKIQKFRMREWEVKERGLEKAAGVETA